MTNTKSGRQLHNVGSLDAVKITYTVSSYSSGGELVAGADLGLPRDPIFLAVICSQFNLAWRWDTVNKKLILFYPHGATIKHNAAPAATTARLTAAPEQLEQTLAGAADVQIGDQGKQLAAADNGGTIEIFAMG